MAGGVFSGIVWGSLVSVATLGAVSVMVPLSQPPQEPTTSVQDSLISEAVPQEPDQPEVVASLRAPVTMPVQPQPPVLAEDDAAPVVDVAVPAAVPVPQTGEAEGLLAPRPLPETVAPLAESDTPVFPNPQALAPMEPADIAPGPVSTETAAPPVFESAPDLPAEDDGAPEVVRDVVEVTQPDPLRQPQPQLDGGPAADAENPDPPVAAVAALPEAPETPEGAPTVGTPATSLISRSPEPDAIDNTQEAAQEGLFGTPPIRVYGASFANETDLPLMSIILIDEGADLDAEEIGLSALRSFPYPLSFAVDASLEDATERMARFRAEGFEVLALVDLPEGALASDAEVSLSIIFDKMPEIVGIMGGTKGGLQSTKEASDHVTAILAQTGHGLVPQSKGLNAMENLARKAGVPAKAVFRDIDAKGQNARTVRRFLDQAAFKAGQEGGVVLAGRLRSETIKALLVWALADRASQVSLAPVTANLLQAE